MKPAVRRGLIWFAQLAIFAFVLWRVGVVLGAQWGTFSAHLGSIRPRWWLVAASILPVVAAYAVLVESWRRLIVASGSQLGFRPAWRIYMVSKLGVYVPGRVWQIAALGMLSRRAGVSPVAATGSAVVGTVANIAAGFVVMLVGGTRVLHAMVPNAGRAPVVVAAVVSAGLLALPFALPAVVRLATRLSGRMTDATIPPPSTLAFVVAANVISWIAYGTGFALLVRALLPSAGGDWVDGLTVFTGSYLAGYLALVVPGGVGVREAAMAEAMNALHLATLADAWILALASRLWLTALEVLPGLVYLARDAALRSPSAPLDGPAS